MLKVVSQIWNCISFLEKVRTDGSKLAVCSHGCFTAAAFFFFFLLTFSTPCRRSWVEFREQSCLSNLSCVCFSCFCVVLGFALRCIKPEWVQRSYRSTNFRLLWYPADTTEVQGVFPRLCEKRFCLPSKIIDSMILEVVSNLNSSVIPRLVLGA